MYRTCRRGKVYRNGCGKCNTSSSSLESNLRSLDSGAALRIHSACDKVNLKDF